jgi:putative two-component system response regulator
MAAPPLLALRSRVARVETARTVARNLTLALHVGARHIEGHSQWFARYATAVGRRIGLTAAELKTLEDGAILHDVGKIAIPDAILLKPGPLTPAEYEIIKEHTVIGERLCGTVASLTTVKPIVRHHHERLDGSGYPDGLRGSQLPLLAQIVGIVDVYDALITDRPYRRALPSEQARQILLDEAHKGWRDVTLVNQFLAILDDIVCAA